MADKTFFSRLQKLFSTSSVIRDPKTNKIKVVDVNKIQSMNNYESNRAVDNYLGVRSTTTAGLGYDPSYGFQLLKQDLYRDYECLAGETKIPLPDGRKLTMLELSELYPDKNKTFYVYSYDHMNKCIKLGVAHSVRKTKTAMTYKITFDNGEYLIATDNHPFLMRNGEYQTVMNLHVGDSLMPFYRKNFYSEKYDFLYNFSNGWQSAHKIVAEQFHGKLNSNEVVHHIDFNKSNNSPENLKIMLDSEHKKYHCELINKNIKWSPENRNNTIASIKAGQVKSKINNPELWLTENKRRSDRMLIKSNNPNYTHPMDIVELERRRKIKLEKLGIGIIDNNIVDFNYIHNIGIELLKNNGVIKLWDVANNANRGRTFISSRLKENGFSKFSDFVSYCEETINHKITSVEEYDVLDVYDMTVEEYHNFATENVFVHNSMDQDSILASALDIYADESTMKNEYGDMLKITSGKEAIKETLENLFYDVLNIEFNLWPWTRNLCVSPDTMIPLLDGTELSIKEIAEMKKNNPNTDIWVYSIIDGKNNVVPGKVEWCDKTRTNAQLIRVTFDDNTYIDTTPDHKFILRDGSTKQASELKMSDALMPFYTRLSGRIKSEPKGYEEYYNPSSGRYNLTHRTVIRECNDLSKEIPTEIYCTHHIDFNKVNNYPNNLKRMSQSDHWSYHAHEALNLSRPDVVEKRMRGIDKWLHSNKHRTQMRERMTGVYKPTFKKYNESELHTVHNAIRSQKMKQHWINGNMWIKPELQLDDNCINFIKGIIINENRWVSLSELSAMLKSNPEFNIIYKKCNSDYKHNIDTSFYGTSFKKMIFKRTDLLYHEFVASLLPFTIDNVEYKRMNGLNKKRKEYTYENHTVKSIEYLQETIDTYCMNVVGPNGEEDRHNFAVCSKNIDGTYSRNGVFIKNCKYGDMYLKLDIVESIGITNVLPLSPYFMVREEDPNNPDEIIFRYEATDGIYVPDRRGKKTFENYEIAHFRLLSDSNFLPYGKSMLEPARKVWGQLSLMEDAMMIHRIMRAPQKRVFKVDIGSIPPTEVDTYMNQVIDKMKKVPYMDESTGNYNLKFNLQNMLEDFYLPVRGGQSGTEIVDLGGMEWTGTEDIEYLRNRMMAALKIPKAFLGYEEQVNAKATLSAEDVRFARTIERIQRIILSELTKMAIVHLYSQGFTDMDLVDFELDLTTSSTVYDLERLELWTQKIALARDAKDLKMLSNDWLYENIFKFSDEQTAEEKRRVVEDVKQTFRLAQIEQEGNDPTVTSESFGTKHDLASIDYAKKNNIYSDDDVIGRKMDARLQSMRPGEKDFNEKSITNLPGHTKPRLRTTNPLKREHIENKLKKLGIKDYNSEKRRVIRETFDLTNNDVETNTDKGTFLDENNII